MSLDSPPVVSLRAVTDNDRESLYSAYTATRAEEKTLLGWDDAQWETFLRMQFNLQHSQYLSNYPGASFEHFKRCAAAAKQISVCRLLRPIGKFSLTEQAQLVEELMIALASVRPHDGADYQRRIFKV